MDVLAQVLKLVQTALDEFDGQEFRLSSAIRKAIRIALLRNDYTNLWWLELEILPFEDKDAIERMNTRMRLHYSDTEFRALSVLIGEEYLNRRKCSEFDERGNWVDKGNICALGVPEIEVRIETFMKDSEQAVPPQGLHPVDLYFADQTYSKARNTNLTLATEYRSIIKRIENKVYDFLSTTEKQLIYGQINSDIFEQNRQYVDTKLRKIAPDALEQFIAVYRRLGEGDAEARSQALLSCRRILKSVADRLYPARKDPVLGTDGKERLLTDDKYIARLWQYVADKAQGKTAGELLLAGINDLGNRVDRTYALTSKGVHADVPEFEVNQCVIQTWLLIGDILRLADGESAILEEPTGDTYS